MGAVPLGSAGTEMAAIFGKQSWSNSSASDGVLWRRQKSGTIVRRNGEGGLAAGGQPPCVLRAGHDAAPAAAGHHKEMEGRICSR